MGYKTINGLMKHLRVNGIAIANSTQKRQLINTGYFHGYKGYLVFTKIKQRDYHFLHIKKLMQQSSMIPILNRYCTVK